MNYPVSNEYPLHGYCGVAGGGRGIVSRSSTLNFFPAKQTVGREGEGWGNDGHCGLLLFTPYHSVLSYPGPRVKLETLAGYWLSLYPSDEFTKDVFGLQTNSHGLGNP